MLNKFQLRSSLSVLDVEFSEEVREAIMGSIAEKWEKQGIEKGIETVARNMLGTGVKIDFIHKTTKIPLTKLKKIQAALKLKSKTKKKPSND